LEPDPDTLWEEVRPFVHLQGGVLMLDDSILDKWYARHMGLVGRFWSGKHRRVVQGIDLVSRLIDGQFPNYQSVLPKTHTTRAVLDREELLRAVRPAALIAHESANIVKLQIGSNGESGITVSANAEVGDHVGQVEAGVEGDGTTIAFNARFLADVLTNVDADQFALELNGPLSPGVFKPLGDDRYVHVVMPLRTTS
jgi:DNA polymerase-3 subunit beta